MPNIKSAVKRVKVAEIKYAANKAKRSTLRTALKKVSTAKPEDAKAMLPQANKALDQAAADGQIHKNKAARTKSRLAKRANAAKA